MAGQRKDWTREEHILAFNLYCKIPFGQIHMHNPRVVQLGDALYALTPAEINIVEGETTL